MEPTHYEIKPAIFAPTAVCAVAIVLASTYSTWWLAAIPCAILASLSAQPNMNLADGCLSYFVLVVGVVILFFHPLLGGSIIISMAISYVFSVLEKNLRAKPIYKENKSRQSYTNIV